MQRRLELARKLLKPTGVIIVAIDDTEHAHLKLLMDQVFNERNFIANVVWQGSGKNDARFVAGGIDYMLIYGRDKDELLQGDVRWREMKPGIEKSWAAARQAWDESDGDAERATKAFRKALRTLRGELEPAVFRYDQIDDEGRVFQLDNMTSPNYRANLVYEVRHPTTRLPVPTPANGWRWERSRMRRMIADGDIWFGPDETTTPRLKRFLANADTQAAMPTFEQERSRASKQLERMLGEPRFRFPKDTQVLQRWIDLVTQSNPDAVVLDFFAGSDSTAQAVMELNAADGGQRQAILVTNNEVDERTAKRLVKDGHEPGDEEYERWGIFRRVTKPRIETVVSGVRIKGTRYSDGLPERVVFYELTYLDAERVRLDAAYEAVAPMLWLRSGAVGPVLTEAAPYGFSVTERYGVLHDVDAWQTFANALPDTATTAFIVTDSPSAFTTAADALPTDVEKVRLYERYISTFAINTEKGTS